MNENQRRTQNRSDSNNADRYRHHASDMHSSANSSRTRQPSRGVPTALDAELSAAARSAQRAAEQRNAQAGRTQKTAANTHSERNADKAHTNTTAHSAIASAGKPHSSRNGKYSHRGAATIRKRKKRKKALVITSITIVTLLAAIAIGIYALIQHVEGLIAPDEIGGGVTPQELKTPEKYKGKGIVNFVVCGIDYNDENGTQYVDGNKIGNTDMVLYVHYDTVNNKVAMMQIPRDTYVGEEVATGNQYKINALFRNAPDKDNRMKALTEVLANQFKLPVDFYVTIDMDAIKEIIEIRGSIEVFVPMVMMDKDPKSGSILDQGWQHLNGQQVEFLLRNRTNPLYNDQNDIARLRTQQYFYSALYREFKALSPMDLVMWMKVLLYRVNTDNNSAINLAQLAQNALELTSEDITFVRPACGAAMYKNVAVVGLEKQELADVLNKYFRDAEDQVPASELGIKEIPLRNGIVPAEIKTMVEIQSKEAPK